MTRKTKSPADSASESTHLVLPPDSNVHGTLFGGRIMEWMDVIAGIAAGRHAGGPVVTLSVDSIRFSRPIHMADVVILKASVNYAGSTSMEVGVYVEREDPQNEIREHCLTGYFTFVAVDASGRPKQVPILAPQTEKEKQRYQRAQERRAQRLDASTTK